MLTEIPWSHQQTPKAAAVDRDQRTIEEKDSRKYTDYWCQDVIILKVEKWVINAHQDPSMVYVFTVLFMYLQYCV